MPVNFKREFLRKMEEHNLAFEIRGVLTADDLVLTLGTDTKVLSTVFELFADRLLRKSRTITECW